MKETICTNTDVEEKLVSDFVDNLISNIITDLQSKSVAEIYDDKFGSGLPTENGDDDNIVSPPPLASTHDGTYNNLMWNTSIIPEEPSDNHNETKR